MKHLVKSICLLVALFAFAIVAYHQSQKIDCVVVDIDNQDGKAIVQLEEQDGQSYKQYNAIIPMRYIHEFDSEDNSGYIYPEALEDSTVTVEYVTTTFASRDL